MRENWITMNTKVLFPTFQKETGLRKTAKERMLMIKRFEKFILFDPANILGKLSQRAEKLHHWAKLLSWIKRILGQLEDELEIYEGKLWLETIDRLLIERGSRREIKDTEIRNTVKCDEMRAELKKKIRWWEYHKNLIEESVVKVIQGMGYDLGHMGDMIKETL